MEDSGVPDPGLDPVGTGPFDENLLENPGLETGDLSGWTLLSSGGSECSVGGSARTGDYSLHTSYTLCEREQTIDLIAAGFTESDLDTAPAVLASEWFKEFFTGGDTYQFQVELKDATGAVLASFDGGGLTTGAGGYGDDEWFEVSHTFVDYGPGLRTITLRDGGKDSEFWAGYYGVRIDDASVMLLLD